MIFQPAIKLGLQDFSDNASALAPFLDGYYGVPLLLEESALAECEALLSQIDQQAAFPASTLSRYASRRPRLVDNVAVIPVHGPISQRPTWWGTSTEEIAAHLQEAAADPKIVGTVLDFATPGGSAFGTPELADLIFALRNEKPIIAVANQVMASAGVWIGTAASRVVVAQGAFTGSVGVYEVRRDATRLEQRIGITTTVIRAGAHKAHGNPSTPLTEQEYTAVQARVDYVHGLFIDAVARNRGMAPDEVRARMGDAQIFVGAQAVDAGLADAVGTLEDVVAELSAGRVTSFFFPDSGATNNVHGNPRAEQPGSGSGLESGPNPEPAGGPVRGRRERPRSNGSCIRTR